MTNAKPPLLLTVREVSKLLRIHRPKVYDLLRAGTIDGFKLGSDWRIKRDSVEKLVGPIPEDFFSGKHEDDGDEPDGDKKESDGKLRVAS
ncbi:MAG: helix-turn-helix domain-containing protein [Oligoflexia bacterium]|nr:helix-turn-helix domain-containing protein [Oligoflexia bacterium]